MRGHFESGSFTAPCEVLVKGLSANPELSRDLRLLLAGVDAKSGVGQAFGR
jgi:hypothetical protein